MYPPHTIAITDHPPAEAVQLSGRVIAFGSMGLSSAWSVMLSIGSHGPEWSQLPPILIAVASLWATINVSLNDRSRRRVAEAALANPVIVLAPGSNTPTIAPTVNPVHPGAQASPEPPSAPAAPRA